MFLLDTNVVSELRKFSASKADVNVARWARATPREQAFISVATVFELERGVLQMKRRDATQGNVLRQWLDDYVLVNYLILGFEQFVGFSELEANK